jgi:predicted negative regulator of RcsB-dependent stress response
MQEKFFNIVNKSTIKALTIIIVVVLIVIAVVSIYCSRSRKINNLSAVDLAKAYSAFANGDQQSGISILDAIIAKYPKTSAAYQALLSRADIFTELQSYDKALNTLKGIETIAKPEIIRPLAASRIIYVYDAKKDYFNAITSSKEFIAKYPNHFLVKDTYLNLAEYYLITGSKDEAIKTFNEVLINFPATREAEKAQKRLNGIK